MTTASAQSANGAGDLPAEGHRAKEIVSRKRGTATPTGDAVVRTATTMSELAVSDAMTHLVVVFRPGDKIPYATKRLLANRISGAPVVEDSRVVGVVSEADLLQAYAPRTRRATPYPTHPMVALLDGGPRRDVGDVTLRDVMTTDVVSIRPDASVLEAAATIDHHGVRRLPVTDAAGHLVGIVARSDLVRCMARAFGSSQREGRTSLA